MKHNRIEEIDCLRGLAVIFMVLVHVLNVYGNFDLPGTNVRIFIEFFGGPPAAPVFMMIMGFLFIQKKEKAGKGILRGLILILIGYLLNFTRGFLPRFIGDYLGYPDGYFPELYSYEYLLQTVDILIFAGLAIVSISIIRKFASKWWVWESIALLAAISAPLLWGLGEGLPFIGKFFIPIWGQDPDLVTFPLFPWIFFPLQGVVLGLFYMKDTRTFHRILIYGGFGLMIISIPFLLIDSDYFFNEYGQMRLPGIFSITGFVAIWSLIISLINRVYPKRFKTGFLIFLSKNLTRIYIIHWILLGWSMLILKPNTLSISLVFVATILLIAISSLINQFLQRRNSVA